MSLKTVLKAALFVAQLAVTPAAAHDGHDLSKIEADTLTVQMAEAGAVVRLAVTNDRDTGITLEAAYTELGEVLLEAPVILAPTASATATLTIQIGDQTPLPGIFTLILDFGEAGYGPVTVIPF